MKIKIERRVFLTPRDMLCLSELYHNVVLSFPQLCRKVFPGKAKSTVLNRLGKLEGMGVVERWRVPVLDSKKPGPGIFVVFAITRKGLGTLQAWRPEQVFRQKPIRLHGYSIHHDVLLVDVVDALIERFPGAIFKNGHLIEDRSRAGGVCPDAILEIPNVRERWAVELETTPKSEKRYREIVLRYQLQSSLDRVLYVCDSREVLQKLGRVMGKMPEQLSMGRPTEKFLWLPVGELLARKEMEKTNQQKEILHE